MLALLSGLMLAAMDAPRRGLPASYLGHPVISGFITASGLLIATSRVTHIPGVPAGGHTVAGMLASLGEALAQIDRRTPAIGLAALALPFRARSRPKPLRPDTGWTPRRVEIATKAAPVAAVAVTTCTLWLRDLHEQVVASVGAVLGLVHPGAIRRPSRTTFGGRSDASG